MRYTSTVLKPFLSLVVLSVLYLRLYAIQEGGTRPETSTVKTKELPSLPPSLAPSTSTSVEIKQSEQKKRNSPHTTLNPPYRIFQLGDFRTASTFQFELLCSIVIWKSPGSAHCQFIKKPQINSKRFQRRLLQEIEQGEKAFVYKSHDDANLWLKELSDEGAISVFSSGGLGSTYSLFLQNMEQVQQCPTCEVKKYSLFFNLTDHEITKLEKHMKLYGILRQCCGLQMSKFEMLRLHGCDVSEYANTHGYPHCERYNLDEIESNFAASPVPYKATDPEYNWAKPGDCKRFSDEILAEKKGFNGKPFEGCQVPTK